MACEGVAPPAAGKVAAGGGLGDPLAVRLGPIHLPNPVLTAAGTAHYGKELARFVDLAALGALVVKGTTLNPRAGNPPPRLAPTPAGLLNTVGLENPGVEYVRGVLLPALAEQGARVIVNLGGETEDEFYRLAELLTGAPGVIALELNISCPNVERGGISFGVDPEAAFRLVRRVKGVTPLPVIPKLTPNVTDITAIAAAVEAGGADAVSLVNTFLGMAIDVERRRPALSTVTGGLSGPAIRPLAVRMVWQVFEKVRIPIIGLGGIVTARDALEFILAGASAVAVGSALFARPRAPLEILAGLRQYLAEHPEFGSIAELVGAAHEAVGGQVPPR